METVKIVAELLKVTVLFTFSLSIFLFLIFPFMFYFIGPVILVILAFNIEVRLGIYFFILILHVGIITIPLAKKISQKLEESNFLAKWFPLDFYNFSVCKFLIKLCKRLKIIELFKEIIELDQFPKKSNQVADNSEK
ncbi:MAG: hypothetical protein ACRCU2_07035 [Planktothrix sp.]